MDRKITLTFGAMADDALGHFPVAGLRGGDIDDVQPAFKRSPLGESTLSRAGATDNKFFHSMIL